MADPRFEMLKKHVFHAKTWKRPTMARRHPKQKPQLVDSGPGHRASARAAQKGAVLVEQLGKQKGSGGRMFRVPNEPAKLGDSC